MNPFDLSTYDYILPPELIAKHPCTPRDSARLLTCNTADQELSHHRFAALADLLPPESVIVLNDTRVRPVRVYLETDKRKHEFVITRIICNANEEVTHVWGLLRQRRKLDFGDTLTLNHQVERTLTFKQTPVIPERYSVIPAKAGIHTDCEIGVDPRLRGDDKWASGDDRETNPQGTIEFRYSTIVQQDTSLAELTLLNPVHRHVWSEILNDVGEMPIPPYIDRPYCAQDTHDYQTVFANEGFSVAAPTAGLHFTDELLRSCEKKSIGLVKLTLDVGYGTFKLMDQPDIRSHTLHTERYKISQAAWEKISSSQHVIAVGTTTLRAIESFARASTPEFDTWCETDLFVTPGFEFQKVTHLVTNFHLPRSSLLCLVMAFGGIEFIRKAYETAIEQKYRFYSYGDAMLISG